LSFAAFGDPSCVGLPWVDLSWVDLPTGIAGDENIARRKYALCKFMIVNLRNQCFKIRSEFEIKGQALRKRRAHSQIAQAS